MPRGGTSTCDAAQREAAAGRDGGWAAHELAEELVLAVSLRAGCGHRV